jgi:hypothetical protein
MIKKELSRPPPAQRPKSRSLRAPRTTNLQRLLPDLKTITAPTRHLLHTRGETVQYVYFPNVSVVSIRAVLSDWTMVEGATVRVVPCDTTAAERGADL